jgi:hypothetical protein
MGRFMCHALIAFSAFIIGVALTTVWRDARRVVIPHAAFSHNVPQFLLHCPEGRCQAVRWDGAAGLPTIKPEVQAEAPLEILLESPVIDSTPGATAIGNLVVRNRGTKPIGWYGITYQVSGSDWSDTFFALYGFESSFPRPANSFIKVGEKRPVKTAQIRVPANAEARLRLYFAIFDDGTTWKDGW